MEKKCFTDTVTLKGTANRCQIFTDLSDNLPNGTEMFHQHHNTKRHCQEISQIFTDLSDRLPNELKCYTAREI